MFEIYKKNYVPKMKTIFPRKKMISPAMMEIQFSNRDDQSR